MHLISLINGLVKSFMFESQGVGTQGSDRDNWVTMYTLEWSEEGESWEPYQEDGHEMVP